MLLVLACTLLFGSPLAAAQQNVDRATAASVADTATAEAAPDGFIEIVFAGGVPGILIILLLLALSMAAVALGVEHLLTIRRDVLIPPLLFDSVRNAIKGGDLTKVQKECQSDSLLADVIRSGLAEVEGGWSAVEKASEDALAERAARLMRKIEYLSVIGNIAPMVGLLGTVVGMILAFQEVADAQGAARAAQLAKGIYQALVTTVGGLIVAIPSLAAYAVFRNRVDQLIAEAAYATAQALRPLKRMKIARKESSAL